MPVRNSIFQLLLRNCRHFIIVILAGISLPAAAHPDARFKIGVILPLTGVLAEYGVAAKNGFELARKENPDLLRSIDFVYDDSQYEGAKALSVFHKFRATEDISLAYIWGYGPCQAVIPVAEAQKFPVIAASAERSVTVNKRYAVRFNYHMEAMAQKLLQYLRGQGLKKVAVVKAELAYMDGLLKYMNKHRLPDESIEVIETFQPGDLSFKSTITKLKSKSFDILGVFLTGHQGSTFFREMDQLGLTPRTVGTDFFDSITVVRDAKGAMNGMVFISPYASGKFVARYTKEYGNDFQAAWAASAYEFALLAGKLFGAKPPLTSDALLADLTNSVGEKGVEALYTYRDSPEGSGFDVKLVARTVKDDTIVDIAD